MPTNPTTTGPVALISESDPTIPVQTAERNLPPARPIKKACSGACRKCSGCPLKNSARNRFNIRVSDPPKNVIPTMSPAVTAAPAKRPHVALVLGGGAAKAAAHLGVINVLDRAGIQVDSVYSSSAGSLIALFYCAGYTPTEMINIMRRDMKPSQFWRMLPGLGWARMLYMMRGGGLARFVRRHISVCDFEGLSRKLTMIASDLENGTCAPLDQGELLSALLASMSLPGLSRPVRRNGQLLVDGSFLNDLPVDLARQRGADVVIAVDLNSTAEAPATYSNKRRSPSAWSSLFLPIQELNRIRAAQADVVIRPKFGRIDWTDFSKLNNSVAIGEAATHPIIPRILDRLAQHPENGNNSSARKRTRIETLAPTYSSKKSFTHSNSPSAAKSS